MELNIRIGRANSTFGQLAKIMEQQGKPQDKTEDLQRGCPINTTVWCGDLGDDAHRREEARRIQHAMPASDSKGQVVRRIICN